MISTINATFPNEKNESQTSRINTNEVFSFSYAKVKMTNLEPKPTSILDSLKETKQSVWPAIFCLLHLMCTFPFSACECERSANCPRRLNTFMRSTMGQVQLTALVLLQTYCSLENDLEKVVNMFQLMHPGRVTWNDDVIAELERDNK